MKKEDVMIGDGTEMDEPFILKLKRLWGICAELAGHHRGVPAPLSGRGYLLSPPCTMEQVQRSQWLAEDVRQTLLCDCQNRRRTESSVCRNSWFAEELSVSVGAIIQIGGG